MPIRTRSLFVLLILLFPLQVFGAGIVINEVLFDPVGSDTGAEFIEIYNAGDTVQDLSGWQIYPDGIGYFLFPSGFVLGSKSFAVLRLRSSGINSALDLYHASTTGNLGNTSGSVALFSGESRDKDTIRSFVQWGRGGETWEAAAAEAGLWTRGAFVDLSNFLEGNSIILARDGVWSEGKDAWKISAISTPNVFNQVNGNSAASSSQVQASQSLSGTSDLAPFYIQTIKVYAGEDKKVAVGSQAEFFGTALGLNNGPLEKARFWWNFGDGSTKEGRLASHIFQVPGKYIIGLHVSTDVYAASDYVNVEVVPNQIKVNGVLSGEEGFVRFYNPADIDLDIGEWILRDGNGKDFLLPTKTKIGAGSEVAFANKLTGLFKSGSAAVLNVYYPNGIMALPWQETPAPPAGKQFHPLTAGPYVLRQSNDGDDLAPRVRGSPQERGKSELTQEPPKIFREAPLSILKKETKDVVAAENLDKISDSLAQVYTSLVFKKKTFFFLAVILGLVASVGFLLIKKFL